MAQHIWVRDIAAVLRHPVCRRISFSHSGVQVNGNEYARVGQLVADGSIPVVQSRATRAGLAVYNSTHNCLVVSTTAPRTMLVVHEATHAINALHSRQVNSDVDEEVAYVAGAIFFLLHFPRSTWPARNTRITNRANAFRTVCDSQPDFLLNYQYNLTMFDPCLEAAKGFAGMVAVEYLNGRTPNASLLQGFRAAIRRAPTYASTRGTKRYTQITKHALPQEFLNHLQGTVLPHR